MSEETDPNDPEICLGCNKSTTFGSGRFINRIPAFDGDREGYLCVCCQAIECDRCGELTNDWFVATSVPGSYLLVCEDCCDPEEVEE